MKTMKTRHDSSWKRYLSTFGEICVFRGKRNVVRFIPSHTPVVAVPVTREAAASGLREWRRPHEARGSAASNACFGAY